MRNKIALLVALGLTLAACSSTEPTAENTPTTEQPTTTTKPSTSTTLPVPSTTTTIGNLSPTSLINGLPIEDPTLLDRRVLAVKIDNHPKANPQSGIDLADMMIELRVEGITRFISIWHESDAEYLGPMRSGRPTDPTLLAALNEPTFAISGAQGWVQSLIVSKDVKLLGESGPPSTFRISGRSAPHNLYVNTLALRDRADANGYPDDAPQGPLWDFGPMSDLAEAATRVTIDFGNTVIWNWDADLGLWLRSAYGSESTYRNKDGSGDRVGVPVLIALQVEQYTASPPAGVSGKSLPSSRTTGSGKAFLFANGRVTEGTWERETELDWFTLKDASGEVLMVPAGKAWLSLVPDHGGLSYSG
jgi:hypothetical protein